MYVCTFVSVVSVGLCVYTLKKEELLSINFDERNREGERERGREGGKVKERQREKRISRDII